MEDLVTMGQMYQLSPYELEGSPLQPSRLIRDREARMIGRMAEEAHLAGREFVSWPKFEMVNDGRWGMYGGVVIRGSVKARKSDYARS